MSYNQKTTLYIYIFIHIFVKSSVHSVCSGSQVVVLLFISRIKLVTRQLQKNIFYDYSILLLNSRATLASPYIVSPVFYQPRSPLLMGSVLNGLLSRTRVQVKTYGLTAQNVRIVKLTATLRIN